MDEREFVESRQASWQRLTAILQKATVGAGLKNLTREELRDLGPLYRRAASDLAYARAHAITGRLIGHLNHLVAQSYALLYQTDTRRWGGLLRFFTHDLPQTFRRRVAFFLAATGFLILGGVIAYAMVAQSRDNIDLFVPPDSMMRDSLEIWESGKVAERIHDAEAAALASFLMQNNIRVSFIAFALGILGAVFTALVIFYNGAILGAFAGAMTHVGQHHNFWPGILPHGVVELSATCLAGAAGLSLGWALLAPGRYRRRDALVMAALDSVKLVIGVVFLLIFAGLVEAFLSHSLLSRSFKVTFGIASGVALYAYLFFTARDRGIQSPPNS